MNSKLWKGRVSMAEQAYLVTETFQSKTDAERKAFVQEKVEQYLHRQVQTWQGQHLPPSTAV